MCEKVTGKDNKIKILFIFCFESFSNFLIEFFLIEFFASNVPIVISYYHVCRI